MSINTKTFILNPIIFYFVMINFMRPACVMDLVPSSFVHFLSIWDKFFGIPVLAVCFLLLIRNRKCLYWDVVSYYFYKIISTILITFFALRTITGGGSFRHIWTLAAILYVSLALKYDFTRIVTRLTYIFAFLVFINFITIVLFPGGMYFNVNHENYFLGYDNGHIVVYIPALFFSYEYALKRHRFVLTSLMWISIFLSVLICKSGTTLLGMFTLVFILLMIHFPIVRRYIFNWKTVSIIVVCVFVLIIVFRKQMEFKDLIMAVFHKDVTLTGRTVLWDRAFEFFKINPIFGTGDNTDINLSMFQLNSQQLSYAHNEILDILIRSGIVGLALYLNCIKNTFKIIGKNKCREILTWLSFVSSFWIAMMFESYSNYTMYYFYFIMLLVPRYIETNLNCDYSCHYIFRNVKNEQ